jgi:hypothetical protein
MATKLKTFSVNVDMTWSEDYTVKAKTLAEAKKKAWQRFKNRPPKKNFTLMADKVETYD